MSRLRLRKPSPAMAVALVALVVSLGGTAAAAGFGPFEGNEIIKKKSLSGNRLKKHSVSGNRLQGHTITGTQINLSKLGKVPTAVNADKLGGKLPTAFAPAPRIFTSPVVKVTGTPTGNTVTAYKSGPFTIEFTCKDEGVSGFSWSLDAPSTEANSVLESAVQPTAGTKQSVATQSADTMPQTEDDERVSLEAPSGARVWIDFTLGINSLGTNCWYDYQGLK